MIWVLIFIALGIPLIPAQMIWNRRKQGAKSGRAELAGIWTLSLLAAAYIAVLLYLGFFF